MAVKKVAKSKFMTEKQDKIQDSKLMKGMTAKQKSQFKREDSKMDKKKPTAKQDIKLDRALASRIKKTGRGR